MHNISILPIGKREVKVFVRCLFLFMFWLVCFTFTPSTQALEIIGSFPSPGSEPRGLTWDGEYIWCADIDSVYKLNPSNGNVISSFPFSLESDYGGITWGEAGNVWIANGSKIFEVDPVSGDTISYFGCPGG
jgi:streptogramin lyase